MEKKEEEKQKTEELITLSHNSSRYLTAHQFNIEPVKLGTHEQELTGEERTQQVRTHQAK